MSKRIKHFGQYKGLNVTERYGVIRAEKLAAPLKIPEENTAKTWLKLSKMLAQAYTQGTWGNLEDTALSWLRQICSADRNFLKGDLAVWSFIMAEQAKSNLNGGKPGRTKLAKHEQKKISNQLKNGVSISQIAREHGVSRGTIRRFRDNHVDKLS